MSRWQRVQADCARGLEDAGMDSTEAREVAAAYMVVAERQVPHSVLDETDAFIARLSDEEREVLACGQCDTTDDGGMRMSDGDVVVLVPPTIARLVNWLFDGCQAPWS